MLVLEKSKMHLTIIGILIVQKLKLPQFFKDYQLILNRIQILCVIFLFGSYCFATFCALKYKASGFSELSEALNYCTIGIVHSSFYYISIWKRSSIIAFMADLEETIEKSMLKNNSIYFHIFFLSKFKIENTHLIFL